MNFGEQNRAANTLPKNNQTNKYKPNKYSPKKGKTFNPTDENKPNSKNGTLKYAQDLYIFNLIFKLLVHYSI